MVDEPARKAAGARWICRVPGCFGYLSLLLRSRIRKFFLGDVPPIFGTRAIGPWSVRRRSRVAAGALALARRLRRFLRLPRLVRLRRLRRRGRAFVGDGGGFHRRRLGGAR